MFVDRRESAFNEAGDYLLAVRDGAIGPDHIRAEIGELLTGAARGRANAEEVTVFKSLGLAIEDLVVLILDRPLYSSLDARFDPANTQMRSCLNL